MANVLIIFGSTGGNTELVCDKVSEVLTQNKHSAAIKRAEQTTITDLESFDVLIFASSTYGQGLLQDYIEPLYFEIKKTGLKGKKCTVIGLGDNKYNVEYVVEAAKILENMVKDAGGELVVPPLRINKTPVTVLNTSVNDWAQNLSNAI
ncbi:flavodoxin family protein [Candidatus Peregrinibacteria bacterium]|nr:flavodoxin family protein [Candidatus Peregrinibacteria bacterium]